MSSPHKSQLQSFLPQPFDWCEIPTGNVSLAYYQDYDYGWEDPQSYLNATVAPFAMAKYPITNAQFAKFIKAGGYQNQKWWTKEGWRLREQGIRWLLGRPEITGKPLNEPLFWRDSDWNGADYPVVGVSWYEALAFCNWLSEVSGEKIMLPTEHQWQRAAEGDDKRIFPWGDNWDASRCNNNIDNQGIGKTSSVKFYEGKGDSPFGVVDMVGNVSEWLLNKSSGKRGSIDTEGKDDRMVRGGSWLEGTYPAFDSSDKPLPHEVWFRIAYRQASGTAASASMNFIGFRISVQNA